MIRNLSDTITGRLFAFNLANPGQILSTLYGYLSTAGVILVLALSTTLYGPKHTFQYTHEKL